MLEEVVGQLQEGLRVKDEDLKALHQELAGKDRQSSVMRAAMEHEAADLKRETEQRKREAEELQAQTNGFKLKMAELEERIAVMYRALDPDGILRSVPGVGAVNAAQILGRLGDPGRFRSLAGVRSFSGLVPSLDSSGQNGRHGGPTKSGDALLREALFMSADAARRIDPTLARASVTPMSTCCSCAA